MDDASPFTTTSHTDDDGVGDIGSTDPYILLGGALLAGGGLSNFLVDGRERQGLIEKLPRLTEKDLAGTKWKEDTCPICYNTFLAIIAEEELAYAMDMSGSEEMGLTRLVETCNHMFCRKDIIKWVREGRNNCPSCRTPFFSKPTAMETAAAAASAAPPNVETARRNPSRNGTGHAATPPSASAPSVDDPLLAAVLEFEGRQAASASQAGRVPTQGSNPQTEQRQGGSQEEDNDPLLAAIREFERSAQGRGAPGERSGRPREYDGMYS